MVLNAVARSKNTWNAKLVPLVSLAVVGYFALMQLARWPDRLRYPGEEDAAEGTQLSEMVHLRRGVPIYQTPSAGQFDSAIYGPFCYLLGGAVVSPSKPAYLPLRLLSLAATLGLATLGAFFVFRITKSKLGAALAPLLLLSNAYVGRYGISARADMVALLLAFGGLFAFYRRRESRRALIAAAVLMLLSFFYKQQFVGAPASLVLYLVLTKRFRQATEFLAVLVLGAASLVGTFSFVVFPRQHFLTHFLAYNRLQFNKSLIVPEVLMFVIPLFVPLLASADFLDSHTDKLVKIYALVAVAGYFLPLLSSGSGADTNRCLEAVLILNCLMAARIATAPGILSGLAWTSFVALTLVLVAALSSAFVVPKVRAEDFVADQALQDYLHHNFLPGTSALTYYAADPIRAGLEAPITNLWHFTALIRKGALSDREVVTRINRGGYGVILLDFDLDHKNFAMVGDFYTTRSMRESILAAYTEQAQLELPTPEVTRFSTKTVHVWVPRKPSSVGAAR